MPQRDSIREAAQLRQAVWVNHAAWDLKGAQVCVLSTRAAKEWGLLPFDGERTTTATNGGGMVCHGVANSVETFVGRNGSRFDMENAMRINLKKDCEPPPPEFRKQGHHMLEIIAAQIKEMEDAGWIYRGKSTTACPLHVVRKPTAPGEKQKWRITCISTECTDGRRAKQLTIDLQLKGA
eukprot:COSAG02_NODE_1247_length_13644_cov_17.519675_10_plen_180_part_00